MSAIWGYVDLNRSVNSKKDDYEQMASEMKKPYEKCVIDRFSEGFFDRGFFACGIQYFSSRAKREELPLIDRENGFVFTADVVLNGKKELIEELLESGAASREELENAPDGFLAYKSWLIWKKNFVDHIIGSFAIAVYDMEKNEFYLFADHTGTRCVNYFCRDGKVLFSTLTTPITDVMPRQYYGINEKWIVASQADNSPQMIYFPGETPFNNVYQVNMGSYVFAKGGDGKKISASEKMYWHPERLPKLKLKDDEYRDLFRKIFFECVSDAIDTDVEISATISSGLDSTSVAGVAAKMLGEQGRKLYGFTAVPLSEYVNDCERGRIPDESEGVKLVLDKYPNIEHEFDAYEGKSGLTEADRLVNILEVPVTALCNSIWIDDIMGRAAGKGCKVFLIGQSGNGTISSGHVLTRVYQELIHGNILEAKRQLAAYGAKHGISRKELFRVTMQELKGKTLTDMGLNKEYLSYMDAEYVRQELIEKYGIRKLFKKREQSFGYMFMASEKNRDNDVLDKATAQNKNIYNTKLGLYHGLIVKDPTDDKRILELILTLPRSEFYKDGVDRRLVRAYLDDVVPDGIRLEYIKRGIQGADCSYRVNHFGKEKLKTKPTELLWNYVEKDNVIKLLGKDRIESEDMYDVLRFLALDHFLTEKG